MVLFLWRYGEIGFFGDFIIQKGEFMRVRLCCSVIDAVPLKINYNNRPQIIDQQFLRNHRYDNGTKSCKIIISETSKYNSENVPEVKYFVYLADSYLYTKNQDTVYLTRTKGLTSVVNFRKNISNNQNIIDSEFYFDCYEHIYDSMLTVDSIVYSGEITIGW